MWGHANSTVSTHATQMTPYNAWWVAAGACIWALCISARDMHFRDVCLGAPLHPHRWGGAFHSNEFAPGCKHG
jgi:hypothetical protein